MMPTSELIANLRKGAQVLDFPVRFQILDVCDRLERKARDNELLVQQIMGLRSRTVKTNADRIRAMSDEELAEMIDAFNDYFGMCNRDQLDFSCKDCELCEVCCLLKGEALDWLRQPAKDGECE